MSGQEQEGCQHSGDEVLSAKLRALACVIAEEKGGMTSMWDISSVLVQCSSTLCWRGKKKKQKETTKGLIEIVADEKNKFKVMGIKTQPVACLYCSKYFLCFSFMDTYIHTHTKPG